MKKLSLVLLSVFSMLFAQTHIVPEGFSGFTASFNHDQNVDFFGEGKFARDSYGNGVGFGYVYNACLLYTSPSPRDKRQSRMPSSA